MMVGAGFSLAALCLCFIGVYVLAGGLRRAQLYTRSNPAPSVTYGDVAIQHARQTLIRPPPLSFGSRPTVGRRTSGLVDGVSKGPAPPAAAIGRVPGMLAVATIGLLAGIAKAVRSWASASPCLPVPHGVAPSAWVMASAGDEGDGAPSVDLDDWRTFRARLVGEARPGAAGEGEGRPTTWAHTIGRPEQGCLLVAQPQHFKYSQTYFHQAVILLVEHDADGTLGLILNNCTDYTVGDVSDVDPLLAANKLFFGGDVGTDTRILHPFDGLKKCARVIPGVYVSPLDQVLPVVRKNPKRAAEVKFFTGYAGWSPGQLQRECNDGVWWLAACSSDIPLRPSQDPDRPLWSEVLELCGGELANIAKLGYRKNT